MAAGVPDKGDAVPFVANALNVTPDDLLAGMLRLSETEEGRMSMAEVFGFVDRATTDIGAPQRWVDSWGEDRST